MSRKQQKQQKQKQQKQKQQKQRQRQRQKQQKQQKQKGKQKKNNSQKKYPSHYFWKHQYAPTQLGLTSWLIHPFDDVRLFSNIMSDKGIE